ncbi:MAG TPA: tetratricopeptide repeat protein [Pyrinomonadaceae bacterium]
MKRNDQLFVFVITLVFAFSFVNDANAKDSWTSVRSKNFLLIGNASEKDIRQVGVKLEQFRAVFTRLFPRMKFTSPVPTTVVVFKSDSSYRPFKALANTAGYFQAGPDVNYITLTTERTGQKDAFDIIFHEYTHLLIDNTIGDPPAWFNEGLAEYYSTFSILDDHKIELGSPIAGHVYLLRQNRLLPLRTLFQVDHKSPYYNESDKRGIFYAQSWALIHYLILNKNTDRLSQMAKFIDLTNAKVPLDEAFTQAFQMTFEGMEKELRNYISQDRYRVMQGRFEQKLETDTTMESAPLTEAEAQAYLGDLLLHSQRKDAESYLARALQLDPDLAMAHASLGMLRFREGKNQEARRSLERAVALNSQNYLIHFYYAYTLSRTSPDEGPVTDGYTPELTLKIREQLRKAISLRPDFPEPYNLLAFVSLVTNTELNESIDVLKRQLQILPNRPDYKFMLAQLYTRNDDYKSARALLDQVTSSGKDEELTRRAQSLLKQIARMEELAEKMKAQRRTFTSTVSSTGSGHSTATVPDDPSSLLREVLRDPAAGETQLQGSLVLIDCTPKGLVFHVRTEKGVLRLTAASFEGIRITTYSPEVQGEITCGPGKPENAVVICYTAVTDKRSDGILRSMEFVPKDFVLKPQE